MLAVHDKTLNPLILNVNSFTTYYFNPCIEYCQ
ncbi:MAG: hypothetical protein ACI9YH_001958 [Colwellia sp.]